MGTHGSVAAMCLEESVRGIVTTRLHVAQLVPRPCIQLRRPEHDRGEDAGMVRKMFAKQFFKLLSYRNEKSQ